MIWFVEAARERPDFRLVISFLWSDFHNVDSDGDSTNPASRSWTWLYLRNRAPSAETVEMAQDGDGSMRVESNLPWLAAATAYFLAREAGVRIRADASAPWVAPDALLEHLGEFDRTSALARADASIWRQSTLENPYPNLARG